MGYVAAIKPLQLLQQCPRMNSYKQHSKTRIYTRRKHLSQNPKGQLKSSLLRKWEDERRDEWNKTF